jgi:hypothetical protein
MLEQPDINLNKEVLQKRQNSLATLSIDDVSNRAEGGIKGLDEACTLNPVQFARNPLSFRHYSAHF